MQTKKLEFKTFLFYIIIILLFLMVMNFDAKFFYFAFLAMACALIYIADLKFDKICVLYIFLTAITLFFNYEKGLKHILRCLAYPFVYLIWLNLTLDAYKSKLPLEENKSNMQKRVYLLIAVTALGSFAHFVLNFINVLNMGFEEYGKMTVKPYVFQ